MTRLAAGKRATGVAYELGPGTTQDVDATIDSTVEVTVLGSTRRDTVPTQRLGATVEVVEGDGGERGLRIRLDRGGASDAAMNDQLDAAVGLRLVHAVDAHGVTADATAIAAVDAGATELAAARVVADLLHAHLRPIPLPTEAIGPGGRWRVVEHATTTGVAADVTTTYRLTRRDGSRLEVVADRAVTAGPQPIGADGRTRLVAMTGTGTATATIDLARPIPTLELHEVYDAEVVTGEQAARVRTEITTVVTPRDR